jgi:hypothetical protein
MAVPLPNGSRMRCDVAAALMPGSAVVAHNSLPNCRRPTCPKSARHSPEFREKWPQVSKLADSAQPTLYKVVHVEEARQRKP